MLAGCTVLDLETVFDTEAAANLPTFAAVKRRHGRWALHRIAAASLLIYRRSAEHPPFELTMVGVHLGQMDEASLVRFIDANLPPLGGDHALVTFNGAGYDLPLLRQRALALRLFDASRIQGWSEDHDAVQASDVMCRLTQNGAATKVSLVDAAASIGLSAKSMVAGTSAERLHAAGRHAELLKIAQQDVVVTFLLSEHLDALRRGDDRMMLSSWAQLDRYVRAGGAERSHLRPFLDHPLAKRTCRERPLDLIDFDII